MVRSAEKGRPPELVPAGAGPNAIQAVNRNRVSDAVLVQLTHLIVDGTYAPGDKLPTERDLSERFGVNRASLREALRRLEAMGMVLIRQGGGIYVRDFETHAGLEFVSYLLQTGIHLDKRMIREIAEMRILVGKAMLSLAATRMTADSLAVMEALVDRIAGADPAERAEGALDFAFYYELAKASGNRIFMFMLNTVRTVMQRVIGVYFQVADNPRTSVDLYRGLLEALRNGDGRTAEELFERRAREDDRMLSSMVDGLD